MGSEYQINALQTSNKKLKYKIYRFHPLDIITM